MIAELQPLYFENFLRHVGGLHHPSQHGIVWHLNHYTFDPVTVLITHENRSEGIVIACNRDDSNGIFQEEVAADDEHESTFWKLIGFAWEKLRSLEAWNQGEKRTETITLVRRNDGWKIDTVLYR